jgi:hypothetical protein
MKNGAFGMGNGRGRGLIELLENPVFTNVARLFIIVILSLVGTLWKTEMNHVNQALAEIKSSVDENIRRQWAEVNAVKKEVADMNRDVNLILYRSNEMLFDVLKSITAGRPAPQPPARQAPAPHKR